MALFLDELNRWWELKAIEVQAVLSILGRVNTPEAVQALETFIYETNCYGRYSNRTRGMLRARRELPAAEQKCEEADRDKAPLSVRQAWVRLLKKVYVVHPLLCPERGSELRVVSFISIDNGLAEGL